MLNEWRRIRQFLTSYGIDAIVVPKRASRRSDRLALILGRNGSQSQGNSKLTICIAAPEKNLRARAIQTKILRKACKILGISIITT